MNFEVIDIEWEDSFSVKYDKEKELYNLGDCDLLDKNGFYQIYGRHPVYGPDVLLYIGETKDNSNGRCFKDRLNEHIKGAGEISNRGRFWFHTNLSIHLALSSLKDEKIKIVESMLIAANKPALNQHHIDTPKSNCKNILVHNWGFLGSLQTVISGNYLLPEE